MKDRAMPTLYKFALEPIGELTADECSFAFLPNRNAKDSIVRMCDVLSKNPDFQWIMKADIKACFDNISHEWILEHIPMDKPVLRKFLKCGYVEHSMYHLTNKGVPQGGCISCVICNMTQDEMFIQAINSISLFNNHKRHASRDCSDSRARSDILRASSTIILTLPWRK